MQQASLSMTGYLNKGTRTRREQFLAEMDQVVPWARLGAPIEPRYPTAGAGARPTLPHGRLLCKLREHAASAGQGYEQGARRNIPGTQRSIARCAQNLFSCPKTDSDAQYM